MVSIQIGITLVLQILVVFSLAGWGIGFLRFAKVDVDGLPVAVLPIVYAVSGTMCIAILATTLNFIMPISIPVAMIFHLFGCAIILAHKKHIAEVYHLKFISLLVATLLAASAIYLAYGFKQHDTALYHVAATKWVMESPIPIGSANLWIPLAVNSMMFSVYAVTDFWLFAANKQLYVYYPILISLLVVCSIRLLKDTAPVSEKKPWRQSNVFFSLSSLVLSVLMCRHLGTLASDVAATIHILFVIYLTIVFFENHNDISAKYHLERLIVLLAAFCMTIKLSAAPVLLIPAYVLYTTHKSGKYDDGRWKRVFNIVIVVFSLCVVKSYLLSGYPVFPSTVGDLNLPWKVPVEKVQAYRESLVAVGKCNEPEKLAHYSSYQWIPRWMFRNCVYDRGLVLMWLLSWMTIKLYGWSLGKRISLRDIIPVWQGVLVVECLAGIAFVLVTAPYTRFAYAWLLAIPAIIVSRILAETEQFKIPDQQRIILSRACRIFGALLLTIGGLLGFDLFVGEQMVKQMILTTYSTLDISKLQSVFVLFAGGCCALGAAALKISMMNGSVRNVIPSVIPASRVFAGIIAVVTIGHCFLEIPVLTAKDNLRLNFHPVEFVENSSNGITTYFVRRTKENPYGLLWNESIFGTSEPNKGLVALKYYSRYIFIDSK